MSAKTSAAGKMSGSGHSRKDQIDEAEVHADGKEARGMHAGSNRWGRSEGKEADWKQFEEQVETAGENVYLKEWWRCMCELEGYGWLTNGGVHMDLPLHRRYVCVVCCWRPCRGSKSCFV